MAGDNKGPNIVFIMADDMGYGDFGVFSDGRCHTPAIDQLVASGICLSQHYSAAPVCTPARAGFLTGRYPHRTGATDMRISRGMDRISTREKTIADHFQQAGYATGLIGKWHNGFPDRSFHPNERGFDEFFGFRNGCMDYFDWALEQNDKPIQADGRYLTDVLTDGATDFIHRHSQDPFFLFVAYNAPHTPLQVPDEEVVPYRETGRFHEDVSRLYGMVTRMDRGIGKILDTLKEYGLEENTVVCLTSDNGPALYGNMDRYNCGFNGGKLDVREGGIRVPMILRWPAGLLKAPSSDFQVHSCDWLPTLTAMAGLDCSGGLPLDGVNVLPVLQGESNIVNPKRYWQWNRYAPEKTCNAAMRDGSWKLVRPKIPEAMQTACEEMQIDIRLGSDPDRFDRSWLTVPMPDRALPEPDLPELYNLEADPGETQNLAGDEPD